MPFIDDCNSCPILSARFVYSSFIIYDGWMKSSRLSLDVVTAFVWLEQASATEEMMRLISMHAWQISRHTSLVSSHVVGPGVQPRALSLSLSLSFSLSRSLSLSEYFVASCDCPMLMKPVACFTCAHRVQVWPLKATFIDKVHEAKAAEALPAYLDKNGRGKKGPLGVILEILQVS